MSLAFDRSFLRRFMRTTAKSRSSMGQTRPLRFELLESRELLAVTPQSLLPDLMPWANQARGFVYGWTVQGDELRLTTAIANIGTGEMQLRGGATHGNTQDVYQRIYEPGGGFTDLLAGTFTHHPEHGHIHFDGFAEFRLRSLLPDGGVGSIVASGGKVSFCLMDVERYNNSGPSSPEYLTCGQVQGISVGWADVYDRGLPGQSINIAGIANGNYWLEVVADPDNHLLESNENNNATRIQINLQRSGGGGSIPKDVFEANNSFAVASILAPPEDHTYSALTIHSSQDVDYYRVTASASGAMSFDLAFQHSQGDVDMEVFNSAQVRIGVSDSASNNEQFSFTAVAGQFYYVRVFGFEGATNPNYTLIVDQPSSEDGGTGDSLEQNDSFATAHALTAADQVYSNLSIDAPDDDDYYRIVPAASGTMTVSLAFQHAQGDIDLFAYNASQAQLGSSDSAGNSEQLSLSVTAGQAYYIRVYGFESAINPNYSMTIDVPEPTPSASGVFLLSTTASGTLSSTTGAADLSFTGADILQLTVQSNGQYQYELYFDGSDVGLTTSGEDIDAFTMLQDGSLVISTTGSFSVPAVGGGTLTGSGEDLLRFVPTLLGPTTAGAWSIYFDGSDVGLSGSSENIDAVAVLSSGSLLVSTAGAPSVAGVSGQDEDLLMFTPTSLGSTTAGSWSMYFDGSDVGLATTASEDVNALYARETAGNPTLYISTRGTFSVSGAGGANEDVFAFTPTTLGTTTAGSFGPGLTLDGSLYGLSSFNLDGIHLPAPASQILASPPNSPSGQSYVPPTTANVTASPSVTRRAVPARPAELESRSTAASSTVLHSTPNAPASAISTPAVRDSALTNDATGPVRYRLRNGIAIWDHLAESIDELFEASALR